MTHLISRRPRSSRSYTYDPKTFDGFVIPTRGRVHTRDADGNADQSLAVITVDAPGVSARRG